MLLTLSFIHIQPSGIRGYRRPWRRSADTPQRRRRGRQPPRSDRQEDERKDREITELHADRCPHQRPPKLTVTDAAGIQPQPTRGSGSVRFCPASCLDAGARNAGFSWRARGSSTRLDACFEFSSISALSTAKHQLINSAAGDVWRGLRVIMHIKPA